MGTKRKSLTLSNYHHKTVIVFFFILHYCSSRAFRGPLDRRRERVPGADRTPVHTWDRSLRHPTRVSLGQEEVPPTLGSVVGLVGHRKIDYIEKCTRKRERAFGVIENQNHKSRLQER